MGAVNEKDAMHRAELSSALCGSVIGDLTGEDTAVTCRACRALMEPAGPGRRHFELRWRDDGGHVDSIDATLPDEVAGQVIETFLAANLRATPPAQEVATD